MGGAVDVSATVVYTVIVEEAVCPSPSSLLNPTR